MGLAHVKPRGNDIASVMGELNQQQSEVRFITQVKTMGVLRVLRFPSFVKAVPLQDGAVTT